MAGHEGSTRRGNRRLAPWTRGCHGHPGTTPTRGLGCQPPRHELRPRPRPSRKNPTRALDRGTRICLVSAVPLLGTLFLRSGARELRLAASNGGGAQRWAVEIALLVPRPPAPSPVMGPRGWGSHATTGRGGVESRAAWGLDSPELGQRRSGS